MAKLTYVTGLQSVIGKMRMATGKIDRDIVRGLKRAGSFLQRESQKIVPVDLGILKGSADTRNIGGNTAKTADITVSYSTEYAVYVHEDLNARHQSGKVAKFLEKPAREKKSEIIKIIRQG